MDISNMKDIDQLPMLANEVQELLIGAEDVLSSLNKPERNKEDLESTLAKFQRADERACEYFDIFSEWEKGEIDIALKSEVMFRLSQLKRLRLVIKNILRLVRQSLGISDPEREQEELQLQLAMMGHMHNKFQ